MILLLALAGGAGAAARFALDGAVRERWPSEFPWGILVVNVLGARSCWGCSPGWSSPGPTTHSTRPRRRVLRGVHDLSTALVDTVRLARDGSVRAGLLNLATTLALTVLTAAFGLGLAVLR